MENIPLFVGLDYHQDSIQVCAVDAAGRVRLNRACANDAAAVVAAVGGPGASVRAAAVEACTGAADFAEELVAATGWRVELAHPAYVARLRGSPDKTDFADGRLLADLTRVGYLPRTWLAPAAVRDLRQLVGHRRRLVDRRRDLRLRVGSILREQRVAAPGGTRWTKGWVTRVRDNPALSPHARWVVGELLDEVDHAGDLVARAEDRLAEATRDDPVVRRLLTVEGVGPVTAWTLAAAIGRFDRFRGGKQLARYCGLSPRNCSSGGRVADGGLVEAADGRLRAVLIQAAHRLVRTHARWRDLCLSLLARGKPKNVAVAAVANRWVRSIHHRMVAAAPADGSGNG
jgi:transposase